MCNIIFKWAQTINKDIHTPKILKRKCALAQKYEELIYTNYLNNIEYPTIPHQNAIRL